MVDFPCHVALVYRLAQVLDSGKDEQFAIENGQLYLIYHWKWSVLLLDLI